MTVARHAHPEIELVSEVRTQDGRRQTCARIICASCEAVGRQWVTQNHSSQHSGKFFSRLGWELGNKPACPACVEAKAKSKKERTMTVVQLSGDAKPRALSPDEKTKVRNLLDACFDEGRGIYLDGQSDQAIAQKLNLPWASVRDYRDIAYGPLKGNEETAGIRADLEKLAADLAALMSKFSGEIGGLTSAKDRALAKLNAIEKKLGFS